MGDLKGSLHHRCRTRIKELGEVFTPENYVEDLLDSVGKKTNKIWSNEDYVFFEPTCGNGNIVIPLIRRRIESLYKNAVSKKINEPHLFAVANTINTLWAIDLEKNNVEECRARVFNFCLSYIRSYNPRFLNTIRNKKDIEFTTHLLCAIKWQIKQNECLSALETNDVSNPILLKTKATRDWLELNKKTNLDFDLSWSEYFFINTQNGVTPTEYSSTHKSLKKNKIVGFKNIDIFNSSTEKLAKQVA